MTASHPITEKFFKGMSPAEWVRFAANFAGERVLKRTAAETNMQTILDTREDNAAEGSL
jgi:acyl-CoA oxidase